MGLKAKQVTSAFLGVGSDFVVILAGKCFLECKKSELQLCFKTQLRSRSESGEESLTILACGFYLFRFGGSGLGKNLAYPLQILHQPRFASDRTICRPTKPDPPNTVTTWSCIAALLAFAWADRGGEAPGRPRQSRS